MNLLAPLLIAAALCSSGPNFPNADALVQVAQLPGDWSEGPVWVAAGQFLIFGAANTQANDDRSIRTALYRYSPTAGLSLFAPEGLFRSNGMAINDAGDLLAAMHDAREIARLAGGRLDARSSVANAFDGRPFNAPNDLVLRRDGTLYFTDPDYEQAGRPGQDATRVYRIATDGTVSVVDDARLQPNGIALSPAEDTLYVGGADNKILRYAVRADGSTAAGAPFAQTDSNVDGMTVDDAGNLYASLLDLQAVAIYSPDGALLHRLPMPGVVTNLAFGGADRKTLFMTCAGQLYAVSMPLPGRPY